MHSSGGLISTGHCEYGTKARHTHVASLGKIDVGAAAVALDHVDEKMPLVPFLTRSKYDALAWRCLVFWKDLA